MQAEANKPAVQPGNKLSGLEALPHGNQRVAWSPRGEAYVIEDAEGALRYVYQNWTHDPESIVDTRVPHKKVKQYGNMILTDVGAETDYAHFERLRRIADYLNDPTMEHPAANLRHLGYVAHLEPAEDM